MLIVTFQDGTFCLCNDEWIFLDVFSVFGRVSSQLEGKKMYGSVFS